MTCLKAWQHYLGFHETKVFTNNVSLIYFGTQPRAMAKELHWHDTLAVMDIDLNHKFGKNNVVPYVLSRKEEYQGKMHWESIQILWAMFIWESDLDRKIQKAYVEHCLAQSYFNDLRQKKKVRGITLTKMETIMNLCAKRKITYKSHARNAWCAHGKTLWWKDNKKVVGEKILLAWNEGRHKAICSHVWSAKIPSQYIRRRLGCIGPSQSLQIHLTMFQWILWHVSQNGKG